MRTVICLILAALMLGSCSKNELMITRLTPPANPLDSLSFDEALSAFNQNPNFIKDCRLNQAIPLTFIDSTDVTCVNTCPYPANSFQDHFTSCNGRTKLFLNDSLIYEEVWNSPEYVGFNMITAIGFANTQNYSLFLIENETVIGTAAHLDNILWVLKPGIIKKVDLHQKFLFWRQTISYFGNDILLIELSPHPRSNDPAYLVAWDIATDRYREWEIPR